MGGFLMVRIMVGFVGNRLRRGKPPDHKEAYHKEARKEAYGQTVHHVAIP